MPTKLASLRSTHTAKDLRNFSINIPIALDTYLFSGVLAGVPNARTAIGNHLLKALHDELQRLNLPACFDIDHESIVAGLLERVNFRPITAEPQREIVIPGIVNRHTAGDPTFGTPTTISNGLPDPQPPGPALPPTPARPTESGNPETPHDRPIPSSTKEETLGRKRHARKPRAEKAAGEKGGKKRGAGLS